MKITSLNMNRSVYHSISMLSRKCGYSKKNIVLMILKFCFENLDLSQSEYGKLTSYQKKHSCESWICFRIDLDEAQCDDCFFYRACFRISLSKLVAVGFYLFFDKLVNRLSGKIEKVSLVSKNKFNNYTCVKKILYNSVKDSFKYFKKPNKNSP